MSSGNLKHCATSGRENQKILICKLKSNVALNAEEHNCTKQNIKLIPSNTTLSFKVFLTKKQ